MFRKLGLIGRGVDGDDDDDLLQLLNNAFFVAWYDKQRYGFHELNNHIQYHNIRDVVVYVEGAPIFLCLPVSAVDEVCREINDIVRDMQFDNGIPRGTVGQIIVIKSTVPPKTTETLNSRYEYLRCVFNPSETQDKIIIGGSSEAASIVKQIYHRLFPYPFIIKTDATTAEMVKHLIDDFLDKKSKFTKEMFKLCEKTGVDYDKVAEYASHDTRLGLTNWEINKGDL
jgi:UDP-glucose 6-dehydrogenase